VKRPVRIVLAAGEPSGDRLGAGLARELKRRLPDAELVGMGGDRMAAEGVEIVQHLREVAVVGISEVLAHFPQLLRARRRMVRRFTDEPTDLFIPIDFPDFNFGLGKAAHRAGVPVVYFVSPQIWAWRRGRINSLRRWVRRMLVLFPFEEALYRDAGIDVRFVGHPLAASVVHPGRLALAETVGVDPDQRYVALMPGSREGEVRRLFPILDATARDLLTTHPELRFIVPVAPHLDLKGDRFIFHRGDFPELLDLCDAGVVAAGTASLEAAVQGLPIVIVHRLSRSSYAIGRRLVKLESFGLPNLVAERPLVPEFIQDDCRPDRIAAAIRRYLDDPHHTATIREGLAGIRQRLGGEGVFERAADSVIELLQQSPRVP